MEFCSGGNLERKIDSGISLAESLDVAEKILTGLQDLHMNGKIHRDLKPENVLFDSAGNPKLTDFGISGHINIQLTVVNNEGKPEQIFGSYAYMAPEQLSPVKRKNTLLPTIDIFSFGVLCYEMISSKLPFGPWETHDDIDPYIRNASKGDFIPFESSLKLDPTWKKIIAKCLSSDREKRYQNVGEVRMDLKGQHFSNDNMPCTSDFKLRILDGEEYGKLYEVALERTICLGRRSSSVKNEVVLEETISNYISRRHATFERIGNGIFIRDGQWNNKIQTWVTSKNGTYVNGILIGSLAGHHLHRNDIITVGNTSIKIY
jgi:serine/threonine protein kinase